MNDLCDVSTGTLIMFMFKQVKTVAPILVDNIVCNTDIVFLFILISPEVVKIFTPPLEEPMKYLIIFLKKADNSDVTCLQH